MKQLLLILSLVFYNVTKSQMIITADAANNNSSEKIDYICFGYN